MEQLRQELEPNLVSLHQRRHHATAHACCAMTCLDRQGLTSRAAAGRSIAGIIQFDVGHCGASNIQNYALARHGAAALHCSAAILL